MRYLLDTHAFIWLDATPQKLSPAVTTLVSREENELLVSLASIWEIQIKHQLGKLQLRLPLAELITEQQGINAIQLLPITLTDVLRLADLPHYHGDPFDRLIIAQAMSLDLPIITHDPMFASYEVQTTW